MSLSAATSPYILLHKDNPVQWRVWGKDALAEAAEKNKPIFLSIGFMGCHWCHQMNQESFSDPAVAAVINEHFIPVIVDREERPDLDQIYQLAAQNMGHQGGWPLSMFLRPDGVPYFVSGYHPRQERTGLISAAKLFEEGRSIFQDQKERLIQNSDAILEGLKNLYERDMRTGPENINLDLAALRIGQRFDVFFGGMQGPMKFPNVPLVEVLWRAWLRTATPQFSQLAFTTLDGILFGGMYDHIGGGVFRYAADERWMIPYFEKALADSAQMIDLCTGIWQFNRNDPCRQRVEETIGWILREMKTGEGFAAGQGSDNTGSDGEADAGRYYLWSEAEIDAGLVGTFSARFKQIYGITRDGNFNGKNILRRLGNPAPTGEADEALLARQREMLLKIRSKRPAPVRDDMLLADWNGMTIAAMARAGVVFERPDWIGAAKAAFDHVRRTLGEGDRLHHSAINGIKGAHGFADDYAHMARAAIQLWEVTNDNQYLVAAKGWVKTLDTLFWDNERGGYCFTPSDADPLIVRARTIFDTATPSANGTMLTVLTRLAFIAGEVEYMNRASTLAATFGDEMNRVLNMAGTFIAGLEYLANALMVVVVGTRGHSRTQELVRTFWSKNVPNALLVQVEPGQTLPEGHPLIGRGMEGGQPTVYVVQQGRVSSPITSAQVLAQGLTLPYQLQQQPQPPQQRTA
ncbi:MAG: thioredoxin domain-containing protein [Alphaproteobacteria bacterium]|nr:thioredoxin domain-containing protein [Alphaproteobacteria bacterium]